MLVGVPSFKKKKKKKNYVVQHVLLRMSQKSKHVEVRKWDGRALLVRPSKSNHSI
jgi:hypothetical protein